MNKPDQVIRVYEDLAFMYDRLGQAKLRDCYLVLAADAAFASGNEDVAERLRVQLLSFNPNHLLRPYPSFGDALRSPDIQSYIEDLRLTHPPEDAVHELQKSPRADVPLEGKLVSAGPAKKPAVPPAGNGKGKEAGAYKFKDVPEEMKQAPIVIPQPVRVAPTIGNLPSAGAAPRSNKAPSGSAQSAGPGWAGKQPTTPTRPRKPAHPVEEEASAASRGFTTFLFVVLLLGGLALAAYTLAGPFLPPEWQP